MDVFFFFFKDVFITDLFIPKLNALQLSGCEFRKCVTIWIKDRDPLVTLYIAQGSWQLLVCEWLHDGDGLDMRERIDADSWNQHGEDILFDQPTCLNFGPQKLPLFGFLSVTVKQFLGWLFLQRRLSMHAWVCLPSTLCLLLHKITEAHRLMVTSCVFLRCTEEDCSTNNDTLRSYTCVSLACLSLKLALSHRAVAVSDPWLQAYAGVAANMTARIQTKGSLRWLPEVRWSRWRWTCQITKTDGTSCQNGAKSLGLPKYKCRIWDRHSGWNFDWIFWMAWSAHIWDHWWNDPPDFRNSVSMNTLADQSKIYNRSFLNLTLFCHF